MLGLARVRLARVGLARVGLARVGVALVGLARVSSDNSSWLGLVYCILLDSTSGTALLDIFPTSPARSAGLVGNQILMKISKVSDFRTPLFFITYLTI